MTRISALTGIFPLITEAIDFHLQAEWSQRNDDGDATGALVPAR